MISPRRFKKIKERKMNDEKLLMKISAIDERTQIILDQQRIMVKQISRLEAKPATCTSHGRMEEMIQKLRLSDEHFTGELNVLDLKAKVLIGGGVVFISSVVSIIVSKFAFMIF